MKNDVFTNKEYLIYVSNEPNKVDAVTYILIERASLRILDHRTCCDGKYYVWRIQSCDAMWPMIKDSLRLLMYAGVLSKGDVEVVNDYKEET